MFQIDVSKQNRYRNTQNNNGDNALIWACKNNNTKIAKLLIKEGVKIRCTK